MVEEADGEATLLADVFLDGLDEAAPLVGGCEAFASELVEFADLAEGDFTRVVEGENEERGLDAEANQQPFFDK